MQTDEPNGEGLDRRRGNEEPSRASPPRPSPSLGDAGVNIEMISTSPIKISCVVREEHVENAVRELHTAFELGADAVLPEDVAGVHRPKVA